MRESAAALRFASLATQRSFARVYVSPCTRARARGHAYTISCTLVHVGVVRFTRTGGKLPANGAVERTYVPFALALPRVQLSS